MNFSKTASYSISVLSYMAMNENSRISAAYLHKKLAIPYPYLRQVLKNLSRDGFIVSMKVRNGGFAFSRKTEKIFLADIIEATDGFENINKCILGFHKCPFDNLCPLHSVWETTRNSVIDILKGTSLADIAKIVHD